MIDEYNANRTGWARFSDDRTMRYRLARSLTSYGAQHALDLGSWLAHCSCGECDARVRRFEPTIRRVVFVMLNPSTADAFKLDNTITKCCQFAQRWGADVLEVVNLFALRSTDPRALYADDINRGDGVENDDEIIAACTGATRAIAAWGNHGSLDSRAAYVRMLLANRGIALHCLGRTGSGAPLHPLARGKAFIPLTREPEAWP